ncbi:MAG: DegT/DnrJ/EryC1/StrS family aminotransferase [Candidatus Eremiobacteraeota bacterium]|nr:DegT/DnrJ/EryC1/StrS family aminotransferase [Candidatus Eremiobacteraeota bacterium]
MPGFEVFGKEEQAAINEIFELNGGILFAHGFDAMRKGVYRVREFETAFAKKMKVPYAQAVASGTAALKVALKALGIKRGDEVIIPAFTFVATAETVLDVGAIPVIVDIDETLNIDPACMEAAITKKTKAVIPVHMLGAPTEMDRIMEVAKKHEIRVLEDNAQGCGGSFKGEMLGTIGDMGTFSLDAGKVIHTGEGGMVLTKDRELFIKARAYHDHGHEYSTTVGRAAEKALLTGFNYRMSEFQGAIGLVQLSKLDMILEKQRENKKKLKDALKGLPYRFRRITDAEGELGDCIVFFLYSKEKALEFARKMGEKGLGTKNLPDAICWHFARHWRHMFEEHGFYEKTWEKEWAVSADLLERSIALPVMVKMTDERIAFIVESILAIADQVR